MSVQHGNVNLPNLQVLNTMLYMVKQDCKWRVLLERFSPRHTACMRVKRFRRTATRYDKIDAVFLTFTHLALIFDDSASVNGP